MVLGGGVGAPPIDRRKPKERRRDGEGEKGEKGGEKGEKGGTEASCRVVVSFSELQ